MVKSKAKRRIRYWVVKIFIITLILAAGVSVVAESLMGALPIWAAAFIILIIVLVGITFDMIGIAFAVCDQAPFVAMASKKIRRAKSAIRLLQNADIVSNICGDVVGDICGIVSGAAGAAIAIKFALSGGPAEIVWAIAASSVIAALTVAGKAAGKTIAIKHDKAIVSFVSSAVMVFVREEKKGGSHGG